jgi:hypothetical protein
MIGIDLLTHFADILVTDGVQCEHTLTVPMRVGDVPVCSRYIAGHPSQCRHAVRMTPTDWLAAWSDSGHVRWGYAPVGATVNGVPLAELRERRGRRGRAVGSGK